jgi:hypothetical protein
MKRAVFLIIIILACITGFLYVNGVFTPAPVSDSGFSSVLATLFDSQYSGIYTLVFLLLLAAILYRQELGRVIHAFYLRVSGSPLYQENEAEPSLANQMKHTEQKVADTEQALNKFAGAIEKYAVHLSSHTGAIRGLHAASQELHKGAAAQNLALMRLMDNMDKPPDTPKTPAWKIDPPSVKYPEPETDSKKKGLASHPKISNEKMNFPPGCARIRCHRAKGPIVIKPEGINNLPNTTPPEIIIEPESLFNVQKHIAELRAKSGKKISRKAQADEALAAEEEIMKAIRNLNAQLDESESQE